jgi:asparagine synthase (glutamine-hydrolysing)
MCGFSGFLGFNKLCKEDVKNITLNMCSKIQHRGPDNRGYWTDFDSEITLAHNRLSILDLSDAGKQPMSSNNGRFVIVFNGEIYNHLELRYELCKSNHGKGHLWIGKSDTETLLACIEYWGIEKTLNKLVGMFAFALWDKREEKLLLARDRIGEKPLYYGWQKNVFLFGSELKALRCHPEFQREINRNALAKYLRFSYLPTPFSIYDNIYKLQPGCFLEINSTVSEKLLHPKTYWSFPLIVNEASSNPFIGSESDATDHLEKLISESIKGQMLSDVPLGAFLSGGIDSSLIVALMQKQSQSNVKTFTIGFDENMFNEANYAKAVAQHLGTDHNELYVTSKDALSIIPNLPTIYDEPFADISQIPTFLVSKLAKSQVSVCLSGDAGDELFCGYNRYILTNSLWRKIELLPLFLRRLISSGIISFSPDAWNRVFTFAPNKYKIGSIGDKLHKGANLLDVNSFDDLYSRFISHWQNPSELVIGASPTSNYLTEKHPVLNETDIISKMMAFDTTTYLPDDILVKVDRAAMSVSLETRIPLLDHRVIDFAWRLPHSMKLKNGTSKWILRKILDKYVPRNLIDRPKMGFGVPIDSWIRGPLREWAESLIDVSRLNNEGFLNSSMIRKKWEEHLSGKRNWQYAIWNVLMFQAWLENEKSI